MIFYHVCTSKCWQIWWLSDTNKCALHNMPIILQCIYSNCTHYNLALETWHVHCVPMIYDCPLCTTFTSQSLKYSSHKHIYVTLNLWVVNEKNPTLLQSLSGIKKITFLEKVNMEMLTLLKIKGKYSLISPFCTYNLYLEYLCPVSMIIMDDWYSKR